MKDTEIIVIYIVKYCLTQGIILAEAEVSTREYCDGIARVLPVWRQTLAFDNLYTGGEWFRTMQEAIDRANEIKARKIVSLNKQLAKLEALTF